MASLLVEQLRHPDGKQAGLTKLVRQLYLQPSGEATIAYLQEALERQGATIRLNSEDRIQMEWPDKEQDYNVLKKFFTLVLRTAHLDDRQFAEKIIPEISQLLLESPSFRLLKQQKGKNGELTFDHIMSGYRLLNTSGMTPKERVFARFGFPCHDLGKRFLNDLEEEFIDGWQLAPTSAGSVELSEDEGLLRLNIREDLSQYHARFGGEMVYDFLTTNDQWISEQLKHTDAFAGIRVNRNDTGKTMAEVEEMAAVLRRAISWHHLGEQFDYKRLSESAFLSTMHAEWQYQASWLPIYLAMVKADSQSINGKENFSWLNVKLSVQAYIELINRELDALEESMVLTLSICIEQLVDHIEMLLSRPLTNETRAMIETESPVVLRALADLMVRVAQQPARMLRAGQPLGRRVGPVSAPTLRAGDYNSTHGKAVLDKQAATTGHHGVLHSAHA